MLNNEFVKYILLLQILLEIILNFKNIFAFDNIFPSVYSLQVYNTNTHYFSKAYLFVYFWVCFIPFYQSSVNDVLKSAQLFKLIH